MVRPLQDPVIRGWAAAGILTVLVLALLLPFVVSASDRHLTAYRDGDEDASLALDQLAGRAGNVEAILSTPHALQDILDPTRTALVILGAERRYSESETEAIVDFVRRGGNVLLADEGGYGTDIARHAGFGFSSTNLLDDSGHRDDPTLVIATARLDGSDYRLLFNAPTTIVTLDTYNEFEVIASSSASVYPGGSFLDTNGDGEVQATDGAASSDAGFPLIIRTKLGEGTLVLVSDTGVFMNEQLAIAEYANPAFLAALASTLVPSDGTILVDEARHAPAPGLAAYDNAVRTLGRLTSGTLAPLVTLAVLLLATLAFWWATRETEDWTHHVHDVGRDVPVPDDLRPDLDRAQRFARRRISERFNMAIEQVAAMPADQLQSLTGDRMLAEAAAGTLRSDPAPLFRTFSTPLEASP